VVVASPKVSTKTSGPTIAAKNPALFSRLGGRVRENQRPNNPAALRQDRLAGPPRKAEVQLAGATP
jgi:hypothetical protein